MKMFLAIVSLATLCHAQQVEVKVVRVTTSAQEQSGTSMPALTHRICNTPTDEQVAVALAEVERQQKVKEEMQSCQPVILPEADKHPTWSWLRLFMHMTR